MDWINMDFRAPMSSTSETNIQPLATMSEYLLSLMRTMHKVQIKIL